jgi:hypothetical protein
MKNTLLFFILNTFFFITVAQTENTATSSEAFINSEIVDCKNLQALSTSVVRFQSSATCYVLLQALIMLK